MTSEAKKMWVLALCVFALFQAALVACKLFGIITCSWWAVFAPVWAVLALIALVIVCAIVLLVIASQYEHED